jgi:hypothetical protein
LLLRDFKRVIPLYTGLLRLAHSSPFSKFLVNPSKEGDLCEEVYPRAFLETDQGKQIPESGLEVGLGSTYAYLDSFINISHAWFSYYKHIQLLILIKIPYKPSYNEKHSQFHSL